MRLILKPIALQFFKRVKEGRKTYHRTHYTKHLLIIIKQWNKAQIICKEKLYYIYNMTEDFSLKALVLGTIKMSAEAEGRRPKAIKAVGPKGVQSNCF